ncbi:MAG: type III-B CRISPR module RAMP protein Cmr6 [Venatoribacter sp.]
MRDIIKSCNDAHAGLLVQRGLERWEKNEKESKQRLIKTISKVKPSELYLRALDRWLLATNSFNATLPTQFVSVAAKLGGRLFTGLSLGGALETGVVTHHAYGMPMLPGSAVKGIVRSFFEQAYCQKDSAGLPVLIKDDKGVERTVLEQGMQQISDILFGTDEEADKPNAGFLIWHDAWWLPPLSKNAEFSIGADSTPFAGEVVTVHQQKYYSGAKEKADGTESPTPNQQLAVQGSFYFVIEGDEDWTGYAKRLLETALQEQGMGAKGASGYGYFSLNEKEIELLAKHCESLNTLNSVDASDPDTPIRLALIKINENDLIENLSKKINKFFTELNLDKSNEDSKKRVANLAWELHQGLVEGWANADKNSNKEKAYKFIMNSKS